MTQPEIPRTLNALDSFLEQRIRESPGFGRMFAKVSAELEVEFMVLKLKARITKARKQHESAEFIAGLEAARRLAARELKRCTRIVEEHE